jgi:proton-translocating NADH-quinone oxidoreductase chain M
MTIVEKLLCLPVCAMFLVIVFRRNLIKLFGLCMSFLVFIYSLVLWINFDDVTVGFQFVSDRNVFRSINFSYTLGIDGMGLLLVLLTTFIIPICILCSWTAITIRVKEFILLLFLIEFLLLHVFTVTDLILFYIFFESVLIPMFLIIGVWGSRLRRIHAAYQFFLYTLLGSLFMLLGIVLLYFQTGSMNIHVLLNTPLTEIREIIIWFSFFVSFAVKVPIIPLHIWLPEAHVEAPTAGSVLLAGILLKMGTYGMIRFLLPIMPNGTEYFVPIVYTISVISILYSSFSTIRQIDIKKVIAYSSVAHMNFVMLGIMSYNVQGIEGSIYLMLGHGVVSSALFVLVGILYERYHTRILNYYGGLVYGMPLFAIFFMFFTLGNVSLPGTSNFVGEILILFGTAMRSMWVAMLASLGIILGAVYAFWLYNRIIFGSVRTRFIRGFSDITRREFLVLLPLTVLMIIWGICPFYLSGMVENCAGEIVLKNVI